MLIPRKPISRRQLLRGAGAVGIGLPLLEAMGPSLGQRALGAAEIKPPKRFVAMCATLGFHTPHLFPEQPGRDYTLTPYLEKLAGHRERLTVISGLSHPEQQGNNGHASELTWLTSAPRPGLAGFRNTISIDQLIADKIGVETRFPYLALSTSGRSMSWTANGVEIPGMTSPAQLFEALFVASTEEQLAGELSQLRRGKSILDTIRGRATQLEQQLGAADKHKLNEYLTAIRDLEQRLHQSRQWLHRPKPKVDAKPPVDVADRNDAIAKQRLMYDMIALALQSDSTRTITFQLSGMNAVPVIPGVSNDWHGLSHHGKDPDKIQELRIIEEAEFTAFNSFLDRIAKIDEPGASLMESTTILYGSNLGNASAHSWRNLPILLAGGPFRHGAYIAHDEQQNTPFSNLFVSIAQQMGVEIERFGSSTGVGIRGLETVA
ncbi:MAG: DUF1552 domain-containing protein [Planctomycetales bacterium]|nr:DUF1552 domain-containing protein [Planctomycetales bacterium]